MLCQNCGRNEANVKYTEVINGEKTELVLCEKCNKELGIDKTDFNMSIDFSSFFGGILGDYNSQTFPELIAKQEELKCDFCSMTYDEFMQGSKFGCNHCYDTFSNRIDSILKTIHGDNVYLGRKIEVNKGKKSEKSAPIEEKIETNNNQRKISEAEELQERLKQAVKEERYEDAAKIRDEIKKRSE